MDAKTFEALADENRLAIVRLLAGGERCVCEVSEELGISGALASHHIKRLREAGIVTTRRRGTWLHCGLDATALSALSAQLADLVSASAPGISACCGRRPDDDEGKDPTGV